MIKPQDLIKSATGGLVGLGVGIAVAALPDLGFWSVVLGAVTLLFFLVFVGLLESFLGAVLWLVLAVIEINFHLMKKALAPLSVADAFGGGIWGGLVEGAFHYLALFMTALLLALLILSFMSTGGVKLPLYANIGIGLGCGYLLGLVIWFLFFSWTGGGPWTVPVWGITGTALGFGMAQIPFF